MEQRRDVQSTMFIFICQCVSAPEIVFEDHLDEKITDGVLPSKTHTKNSGRYFFSSEDTVSDCQSGEQSQIP